MFDSFTYGAFRVTLKSTTTDYLSKSFSPRSHNISAAKIHVQQVTCCYET
jgi:hypothetical protein